MRWRDFSVATLRRCARLKGGKAEGIAFAEMASATKGGRENLTASLREIKKEIPALRLCVVGREERDARSGDTRGVRA